MLAKAAGTLTEQSALGAGTKAQGPPEKPATRPPGKLGGRSLSAVRSGDLVSVELVAEPGDLGVLRLNPALVEFDDLVATQDFASKPRLVLLRLRERVCDPEKALCHVYDPPPAPRPPRHDPPSSTPAAGPSTSSQGLTTYRATESGWAPEAEAVDAGPAPEPVPPAPPWERPMENPIAEESKPAPARAESPKPAPTSGCGHRAGIAVAPLALLALLRRRTRPALTLALREPRSPFVRVTTRAALLSLNVEPLASSRVRLAGGVRCGPPLHTSPLRRRSREIESERSRGCHA